MMSSEEKQYRCEECGRAFSSQGKLQQHNNQEHVGTA
jgi:DNA-directed RNA polymerase subunit RPC12/RpoP